MKPRHSLAEKYEHFYDMASVVPQQTDAGETAFFAGLGTAPAGSAVADIGCAEGMLCVALARRGYAVTAVDISPRHLESARANAAKAGVALTVLRADIASGPLPVGGKPFQTVYLMDVIEHLMNPVAALGGIRAVMADDGELIINTPNAFALHRILRYLRHPARLHDFFDPRNLQDLHFNTYDYLTLEKTLNFTGLKIVELIPNRLTPPLTWSLRWFDPVKRLLSRGLPKFSDNLLVRCVKCDPIDVASQVVHWRKTVR